MQGLYLGGATWQSGLLAAIEGVLVTTAPSGSSTFPAALRPSGARRRQLARSAFAAFLVHQGVLVALVLASRQVGAAPEVSYLAVASLGIVVSFLIGWLLSRCRGCVRIV